MRIGYFEHWHRPPYTLKEFLQELGIEITKIDYSQKGYLEPFDVVIIEQNGFNDYIENDELYIQDWVHRGGILLFMHQSYERWAPYFLPGQVGYTQLIHRYVPTINAGNAGKSFTDDHTRYMHYMMPWIEEKGRRLFAEPNVISPEEMLYWRLTTDTFGITHGGTNSAGTQVRTAAQDCFLVPENWDVLGTHMDPATRNSALITKVNYGKGMYFCNQILFPEVNAPEAERTFAFWRKYIPNLLAYFARFRAGEAEILPREKKTLPIKKNYKMPIHMHSLDWYGADADPGTIYAIMRYMDWDICALAVKDNAPFNGNLDTDKYSDDKVLFLHGQEYHPFNWNDRYSHVSHNTYHLLAIGIDPDAYTTRYTRSLFSDQEIDAHLQSAVEYVHSHGGAVIATHPNRDFWKNYAVDGADIEPLGPLSGTDIEAQWLAGKRFAFAGSVDLFGARRVLDNPTVNFLYLGGEVPCRDSVVKAIRSHHIISACGFAEADICIGDVIPGDEISLDDAKNGVLSVCAKVSRSNIEKIRVYAGADEIYSAVGNGTDTVNLEIPLKDYDLHDYIRVELEGMNERWICCSTPIWQV